MCCLLFPLTSHFKEPQHCLQSSSSCIHPHATAGRMRVVPIGLTFQEINIMKLMKHVLGMREKEAKLVCGFSTSVMRELIQGEHWFPQPAGCPGSCLQAEGALHCGSSRAEPKQAGVKQITTKYNVWGKMFSLWRWVSRKVFIESLPKITSISGKKTTGK